MFNSINNNQNSGLTTLEEVIEEYNQSFDRCNMITKIELRAWLTHSKSRHANGNKPFTYSNYSDKMTDSDYLEQIKLGVFDCVGIGDKEVIIDYLEMIIKQKVRGL